MALFLFALVVWRKWPIELVQDDFLGLLEGLFGLACVLGPDEVVYYGSLRGQGYSSYTGSEARTFEDTDLIRVVGFVLLLDALWGIGEWLIWSWW